MRVNAIIAEYNPFHNGHLYQLNESSQQTDADYTIVLMSGNFVQRGAPAIIDKYTRAKMALLNGADLVLELPSYSATGSAEFFARGAISLLNNLGIVTTLSFGSECGNLSRLLNTATVLSSESPEFQTILKKHLSTGLTYPLSLQKALQNLYGSSLTVDITQPNNILALEYCKALMQTDSTITPFTITRKDTGYHETQLSGSLSSANAIRLALGSTNDNDLSTLQNTMPESAYDLLVDSVRKNHIMCSNDFSSVLHYCLLTNRVSGLEHYLDVTSDLSDRIQKHLNDFETYEQFCELIKTKNITYARISRCLLHILLGITKEDNTPASYIRILGFRKAAKPLLSSLKSNCNLPLVTKLADAEKLLSSKDLQHLQKELSISRIYYSVRATQHHVSMLNEYKQPIIIT
jgi:predicted nucleotidyltransferase